MPGLTSKQYLEVPASSLNNNRADIDRINAALKEKLDGLDFSHISVDWPLDIIPYASETLHSTSGKITLTFACEGSRLRIVAVEPGDTTSSHYGLAIDLGTTVVAVDLVDLSTGKPLASVGEVNKQVQFGEDLLSRLHLSSQGSLDKLNKALIDTINKLLSKSCASAGIEPGYISAISAAGNTSMTHFFLGIDPSLIRMEPYTPVINHVPLLSAKEIGVDVVPHAPVYVFPSVGGYFGGDIIADAVASGIAESDDVSLLLDIGTNVEVVLGNKDWLIALAGSAGPALESGVAECARRAGPGAIEKVVIDVDTLEPEYEVIGDAKPEGLCGSGLIDTVAQLYLTGLLDPTGRFVLDNETSRWQTVNGRTAYVLVEANVDVGTPATYITEKDIQNLLRTKAAMVAALTVLLNSVGLELDAIQRVYTAGSFGIHLDVESATAIGLYPKLPKDRFITLGNGSLKGAREVLLDASNIKKAEQIADKITYLELNVHPEFMEVFRSAGYL